MKRATQKALRRPRVHNLYLHYVPPSQEATFVSIIRNLSESHSVISYSDGVQKIVSGDISEPFLTISFDDGFGSNLRAAEILAAEGMQACFFVCPNLVGLDRASLRKTFPTSLGEETRSLGWDEILKIKDMGHEIGSHTMDHTVLADVPVDEAIRQIRESKEVLEHRIGEISHFAWPRGQFHHFREGLISEVYQAGYESCSSAVRGAHLAPTTEKYPCIRREHWDTAWPSEHLLYLMGRSIRHLSDASGKWPAEWHPVD